MLPDFKIEAVPESNIALLMLKKLTIFQVSDL